MGKAANMYFLTLASPGPYGSFLAIHMAFSIGVYLSPNLETKVSYFSHPFTPFFQKVLTDGEVADECKEKVKSCAT